MLVFSSINSKRFRKHSLFEIATTVRLSLWALPSLIDRVNFYTYFYFNLNFSHDFFTFFLNSVEIWLLYFQLTRNFISGKKSLFFQFIDYFKRKNVMIKLHGFWKNGIEIRIDFFFTLSATSMPVVKLPTKTLCSHYNFLFNIYSCLSSKPFQLIKRSFKWVIHVIMLCFATMCKFNNLNWP